MKINTLSYWHAFSKFLLNWNLDYYRVIHSFKTAIACLLGIGLFMYFDWPTGQWVPITIMVVMSAQTHFGGALQKAYMRFLGTLSGVTITVLTLLVFGNNIYVVFLVVFFASLVFTYIASGGGAISYAGTLGGVTVVLTLTGAQVDPHYALVRGCYIVIGIIIALLVSRFCFPIHAREKLRLSVIDTLRNLRKLYFKTIQADIVSQQPLVDSKLDSLILKNLADQPQLIDEAAVGSRYFSLYKKHLFVELVSSERRIYRLIYFMYKSLCEACDFNYAMHKIGNLENLHVIIEENLSRLADSVENFSIMEENVDLLEAIKKISLITEELPQEMDIQKMLSEHSFLFLLEQVLKELENLQNLIRKINTFKGKEQSDLI